MPHYIKLPKGDDLQEVTEGFARDGISRSVEELLIGVISPSLLQRITTQSILTAKGGTRFCSRVSWIIGFASPTSMLDGQGVFMMRGYSGVPMCSHSQREGSFFHQ
ncbi:hypothetical protein DPEC_G00158000 [Dallia pectoralis]|uniref:Uncharacterized protein n=1 Tax=Dallia pectoralis TaxID=75939 RepID=A0ACC2GLL8_DALPE|nr:hypothetical protein DPEC_G00158000 [Dallia pectoralis]